MSVRTALAALAATVLVGALTGCSDAPGDGLADDAHVASDSAAGSGSGADAESDATEEPAAAPARVWVNVGRRAVAVDHLVRVSAAGGELLRVRVGSSAGRLPGRLGDHGSWVASELLEPGTRYRVSWVVASEDGARQRDSRGFRTRPLNDDEQAFASIAPLDGETVGIGMPVVVFFDAPVADRAALERHMAVTSEPAQRGSWHWLSDTEVHWRPRQYWRSGSQVSVDLDIDSVHAGAGVFGEEDRHIDFEIGAANVYRVDAATHQMQVLTGGDLLRTIPITTGGPGYTTRSGVKVIMEKWESRTMNSETVGIDPDGPDGYVIEGVQYAMRLTYSGEFIHAAPWSVGSQGVANVSHGCTGMSTENARWLFEMSKRGDVVEYVGTDRPMELANGFGDWNLPYVDYARGSALG